MNLLRSIAAVSLLVTPGMVAAILPVTSYSTQNGATGAFDYRDFTYLPCPAAACTTTGAPLSGGTGKLTDGISPTLDWYQQGNLTSWVGFDNTQGLSNPTITFNFGQTVNIVSTTIWLSNSRSGGVALPSSVLIGGATYVIPTDTVNLAPRALTFGNFGLTGNSVAVQLDQAAGFNWVIAGEVSFTGTPSAVPEPGTLAVFAFALPVLALVRRKTRKDF